MNGPASSSTRRPFDASLAAASRESRDLRDRSRQTDRTGLVEAQRREPPFSENRRRKIASERSAERRHREDLPGVRRIGGERPQPSPEHAGDSALTIDDDRGARRSREPFEAGAQDGRLRGEGALRRDDGERAVEAGRALPARRRRDGVHAANRDAGRRRIGRTTNASARTPDAPHLPRRDARRSGPTTAARASSADARTISVRDVPSTAAAGVNACSGRSGVRSTSRPRTRRCSSARGNDATRSRPSAPRSRTPIDGDSPRSPAVARPRAAGDPSRPSGGLGRGRCCRRGRDAERRRRAERRPRASHAACCPRARSRSSGTAPPRRARRPDAYRPDRRCGGASALPALPSRAPPRPMKRERRREPA